MDFATKFPGRFTLTPEWENTLKIFTQHYTTEFAGEFAGILASHYYLNFTLSSPPLYKFDNNLYTFLRPFSPENAKFVPNKLGKLLKAAFDNKMKMAKEYKLADDPRKTQAIIEKRIRIFEIDESDMGDYKQEPVVEHIFSRTKYLSLIQYEKIAIRQQKQEEIAKREDRLGEQRKQEKLKSREAKLKAAKEKLKKNAKSLKINV